MPENKSYLLPNLIEPLNYADPPRPIYELGKKAPIRYVYGLPSINDYITEADKASIDKLEKAHETVPIEARTEH